MKFTPASGHIGADVHGVDLSRPLSSPEVAAIREGLLEHLVLFFREQTVMSTAQHKALAAQFGELETTNYVRPGMDEKIELVEQTGHAAFPGSFTPFHADTSFKDNRVAGSILQAHVLPERGGDTCFASMYAAYDALSPAMREFLGGLTCVHSLMNMHRRHIGNPAMELRIDPADHQPISTPVIRVHPETGRKFLNVNPIFTSHIEGLRDDESELLLKFLYNHVQRPEFGVRLRWNLGDVAYWDNWSTQHTGVPDFTGHRRLHRISIFRFAADNRLTEAA